MYFVLCMDHVSIVAVLLQWSSSWKYCNIDSDIAIRGDYCEVARPSQPCCDGEILCPTHHSLPPTTEQRILDTGNISQLVVFSDCHINVN